MRRRRANGGADLARLRELSLRHGCANVALDAPAEFRRLADLARELCVASAAMPNVADSLLGLFHPKQERPPPAISAPKPATTASPPRRRNSARKSAPHGSHDGPSSAPWAIKDEDKKRGAGLLFSALKSGTLQADIGQRFPLSEAARAHAAIESGTTTGATVLVP